MTTDIATTPDDGLTTVDKMAGFLAVASLVLSGLALFRTPALYTPIAAIIGFAATRMSVRSAKLSGFAVIIAFLAFIVGMTLAVLTDGTII